MASGWPAVINGISQASWQQWRNGSVIWPSKLWQISANHGNM
jgi:hypothetical protein